ncbi:MAG TPA: tetratricopeptide repeat protein, partial [Dongiaceae bacterium]|nr:tetratricopeptide repeat protein [Dongiaceae bacterium]
SGYTDQAIALLTDLLSLAAGNDEVMLKLARLHVVVDHIDEAQCLLQNFTENSPFFSDALFMLGMIFADKRNFAEGAEYFRSVLKLDDRNAEAHNNLALCLMELARPEEAQEHFVTAIKLAPDRAEACNNLGNLLVRYWKLAEASESYRRAIEIKHDYAGAYSNLGRIANYEGRIDDSVALFLKALEIMPDFRAAADNLLSILNNSDKFTPEQVSKEHFRLSAIYPVSGEKPPQMGHRQGRKIRIGYVSSDFKSHSVGFFIEPVLKNHSRDDFEIFCYDQVTVPDETTERIKNLGWTWRPVFGLPDSKVAELVRMDAIDILVDLSGHFDGNRLGVFALRPAPVQVTWLGYPNTTGLNQINFRLTDEFADPTGMTDHLYSERLIRLPRTFLCYAPPVSAPAVAPFPGEPVIFCCFNNYPKVSDTVLKLWAKVLHSVPGSKLFLKSGPLGDSGVRALLTRRFAALGIDQTRLILAGFAVRREEHLQRYGACHIALDTYPYNGTTTTCEALWMGVPVVTLAGTSHAARVGVSILNNVGLSELIAQSADQYVDIAAGLAKNPARLRDYRASLRTRLLNSRLMDAGTFTADLEQAYRRMVDQLHVQ